MTRQDILSIFCRFINGNGIKAIQGPSDNPAPKGKYISIVLGGVRQIGEKLVPGPANGKEKSKEFMQVATIQLYEVEGDGEALRKIRNLLQTDEFDEFVMDAFRETSDGGFSVWDISDITDNSSQDGAFWIEQRTMTVDVQFYDRIAHTDEDAPRMASVCGKLNDTAFKAEV